MDIDFVADMINSIGFVHYRNMMCVGIDRKECGKRLDKLDKKQVREQLDGLKSILNVFIEGMDFVHGTEQVKESVNGRLIKKYYDEISTYNRSVREEYLQCMLKESHKVCIQPVNKSLPFVSDKLNELKNMLV